MGIADIFPKRLREGLSKPGKTQRGLSEFISKDPSQIQRYLSGQYKPSFETLDQIAEYVEESPQWLMGGSSGSLADSLSEARERIILSESIPLEILEGLSQIEDYGPVKDFVAGLLELESGEADQTGEGSV